MNVPKFVCFTRRWETAKGAEERIELVNVKHVVRAEFDDQRKKLRLTLSQGKPVTLSGNEAASALATLRQWCAAEEP